MASKESPGDGADAKTTAAPDGTPVQPARSFLKPLMGGAALGALFALAWVFSQQIRNHAQSVEPAGEGADVKAVAKPAVSVENPADLLARADDAMRQYRFAIALAHYQELRSVSTPHVPLIDYRLALCNEATGQLDRALAGYRASISGAHTPALLFACHLGMARCLFRQGNLDEARKLLYPFILDETRSQGLPRRFMSDARYLIALAQTCEWPASETDSSPAAGGRSQLISISTVGLETPNYLDEVAILPKESLIDPVGPKRKDLELDMPSANRPAAVVKWMAVTAPTAEVLDRLAVASGRKDQLSDGARESLADRSVKIRLHDWLLDDLLELLAEHHDLVCWTDGAVRRISRQVEMEEKRLAALRRERGERALRGALLEHPAHPWAAAACLELGNREAAQGKDAEAAGWYERLVHDAPNSPYVPAAYFNRALLHLDKNDLPSARKAFFQVIDQAPGHELALKAYIRIGMSYLEDGNAAEGIVHLRRAQATAPQSDFHAHATVALAAGLMMNRQPEKARAVLARERTLLHKSPCKTTGAFLDALAQFQLARESSPARREASDLLGTLLRDQDRTVLGPLGNYLVAHAYSELGFPTRAEQLLREAVPHCRGNLALAVDFSLAEILLKQQQRKEAETLLVKLAQSKSSYRAPAKLQVAQLHLQDKKYQECAELCREIWIERSELEAAELLRVWGSALEGMGEFAKAAQCFAGKPPE